LQQNYLLHGVLTTDLREEACVCDENYDGPECAHYIGTCDPKCAHGCHGPLSKDCHMCVENASRETDDDSNYRGYCVCSGSWTGDDCSIPGVQCHITCESCYGPEAHQCESCHMGSALTRVYDPANLAWASVWAETGYDERDGDGM
jgi:hypothetical protein